MKRAKFFQTKSFRFRNEIKFPFFPFRKYREKLLLVAGLSLSRPILSLTREIETIISFGFLRQRRKKQPNKFYDFRVRR
jgi:hypothetical protein